MNVADPLVYASLPVIGGALVWIGQQFVQSVVAKNRENTKTNAVVSPQPISMSVDDYQKISALLKQELNGRYMFAKEAREKFSALEEKLDDQSKDIKSFILDHVTRHESKTGIPLVRAE